MSNKIWAINVVFFLFTTLFGGFVCADESIKGDHYIVLIRDTKSFETQHGFDDILKALPSLIFSNGLDLKGKAENKNNHNPYVFNKNDRISLAFVGDKEQSGFNPNPKEIFDWRLSNKEFSNEEEFRKEIGKFSNRSFSKKYLNVDLMWGIFPIALKNNGANRENEEEIYYENTYIIFINNQFTQKKPLDSILSDFESKFDDPKNIPSSYFKIKGDMLLSEKLFRNEKIFVYSQEKHEDKLYPNESEVSSNRYNKYYIYKMQPRVVELEDNALNLLIETNDQKIDRKVIKGENNKYSIHLDLDSDLKPTIVIKDRTDEYGLTPVKLKFYFESVDGGDWKVDNTVIAPAGKAIKYDLDLRNNCFKPICKNTSVSDNKEKEDVPLKDAEYRLSLIEILKEKGKGFPKLGNKVPTDAKIFVEVKYNYNPNKKNETTFYKSLTGTVSGEFTLIINGVTTILNEQGKADFDKKITSLQEEKDKLLNEEEKITFIDTRLDPSLNSLNTKSSQNDGDDISSIIKFEKINEDKRFFNQITLDNKEMKEYAKDFSLEVATQKDIEKRIAEKQGDILRDIYDTKTEFLEKKIDIETKLSKTLIRKWSIVGVLFVMILIILHIIFIRKFYKRKFSPELHWSGVNNVLVNFNEEDDEESLNNLGALTIKDNGKVGWYGKLWRNKQYEPENIKLTISYPNQQEAGLVLKDKPQHFIGFTKSDNKLTSRKEDSAQNGSGYVILLSPFQLQDYRLEKDKTVESKGVSLKNKLKIIVTMHWGKNSKTEKTITIPLTIKPELAKYPKVTYEAYSDKVTYLTKHEKPIAIGKLVFRNQTKHHFAMPYQGDYALEARNEHAVKLQQNEISFIGDTKPLSTQVSLKTLKETAEREICANFGEKGIQYPDGQDEHYKIHVNGQTSDGNVIESTVAIAPDPQKLEVVADITFSKKQHYQITWNELGEPSKRIWNEDELGEAEKIPDNELTIESGKILEVRQGKFAAKREIVLNFKSLQTVGHGKAKINVTAELKFDKKITVGDSDVDDITIDKDKDDLKDLFIVRYDHWNEIGMLNSEKNTGKIYVEIDERKLNIIKNINSERGKIGLDRDINEKHPAERSLKDSVDDESRINGDISLRIMIAIELQDSTDTENKTTYQILYINQPIAFRIPCPSHWIAIDYGTSAMSAVLSLPYSDNVEVLTLQGGGDDINYVKKCDYKEIDKDNDEAGTGFLPSYISCADLNIKNELKELQDQGIRGLPLFECTYPGSPAYITDRADPGDPEFISFPALIIPDTGREEAEKIQERLQQHTIYSLKSWLTSAEENEKYPYGFEWVAKDGKKSKEKVLLDHLLKSSLSAFANTYIKNQAVGITDNGPAVILTYPNTYTLYQRRRFYDIAWEALKKPLNLKIKDYLYLVSESDAAAFAQIHHSRKELKNKANNKEQKILIFDMGAGTLDTSLINIAWHEYGELAKWQVLSRMGLPLGGNYLDQLLVILIHKILKDKENYLNSWPKGLEYIFPILIEGDNLRDELKSSLANIPIDTELYKLFFNEDGKLLNPDSYYKLVTDSFIKRIKKAKHNWSEDKEYLEVVLMKSDEYIIAKKDGLGTGRSGVKSQVAPILFLTDDLEFKKENNIDLEKIDLEKAYFKVSKALDVLLCIPSKMINEDSNIQEYINFITTDLIQETTKKEQCDAIILSGRATQWQGLKQRIESAAGVEVIGESTATELKEAVPKGALLWQKFGQDEIADKSNNTALRPTLLLYHNDKLTPIPQGKENSKLKPIDIDFKQLGNQRIKLFMTLLSKSESESYDPEDLKHKLKSYLYSQIGGDIEARDFNMSDSYCRVYYREGLGEKNILELVFEPESGGEYIITMTDNFSGKDLRKKPWPASGEVLKESDWIGQPS